MCLSETSTAAVTPWKSGITATGRTTKTMKGAITRSMALVLSEVRFMVFENMMGRSWWNGGSGWGEEDGYRWKRKRAVRRTEMIDRAMKVVRNS